MFQKWPFSKAISSAIYGSRSGLVMDYESMGLYLKSVGPDFGISDSFWIHRTLKVGENRILHEFQAGIAQQRMARWASGGCHWIEQQEYYIIRKTHHARHVSRDRRVIQQFGDFSEKRICRFWLICWFWHVAFCFINFYNWQTMLLPPMPVRADLQSRSGLF